MTRDAAIEEYHARLAPGDREIADLLAAQIERGLPESTGSFQAADVLYVEPHDVDPDAVAVWLAESRSVQWDYENIRRNRGLVQRTDF